MKPLPMPGQPKPPSNAELVEALLLPSRETNRYRVGVWRALLCGQDPLEEFEHRRGPATEYDREMISKVATALFPKLPATRVAHSLGVRRTDR